MSASRNREQQEKRRRARAAKASVPTESLFVHNKAECDCRHEILPIEIEPGREIRQVLHFDSRGKLVWFAVLYNKVRSGRGIELYSVDTSHGYYHEHTHGHRRRNDRRDISPLYAQVHVQECFDTGYDTVLEKHDAMSGR